MQADAKCPPTHHQMAMMDATTNAIASVTLHGPGKWVMRCGSAKPAWRRSAALVVQRSTQGRRSPPLAPGKLGGCCPHFGVLAQRALQGPAALANREHAQHANVRGTLHARAAVVSDFVAHQPPSGILMPLALRNMPSSSTGPGAKKEWGRGGRYPVLYRAVPCRYGCDVLGKRSARSCKQGGGA